MPVAEENPFSNLGSSSSFICRIGSISTSGFLAETELEPLPMRMTVQRGVI